MFRMPVVLSTGLALAAAVPAPGQTPAAAGDPDVRCWIASNVFAGAETDAQRKQLAQMSVFFYLGRVDAKMSAAQMKAQMVAISKTVDPKTLGPVMNACAQKLIAKQQAMQAIGKEILASQPKPPAGAAPAPAAATAPKPATK